MGPGTPTPVSFSPRSIGHGKPLDYSPKNHEVQADVARANSGQNLNAQFQPRPPIHPPGAQGIGDSGSIVDVKA
jgi:hypothetical protein